MVYKRYIYRNGKKFGPYYYESYRDKHGIARTRYAKHKVEEKKSKLQHDASHKKTSNKKFKLHPMFFILLAAIILIILGIGFLGNYVKDESGLSFSDEGFSFSRFTDNVYGFMTGFASDDSGEEAPVEDPPAEEVPVEEPPVEDAPVEETVPEETTEEVEEIPVEENPVEEIPEESTEEVPVEESVEEINETIIEEPEINVTIEEPETNETIIEEPDTNETIKELETNETIGNETQETPEIIGPEQETDIEIPDYNLTNQTETNVTIGNMTNETIVSENVTIINQTLNISTEVSVRQYGAVLGKPVKWEKKVKVKIEGEEKAKNLKIELPKLAGNVSVKKKTDLGEEDVNAFISGEKSEQDLNPGITGNVFSEGRSNGFFTGIFNFILGFFKGMTGFVVDEGDKEVSVEIEEELNNNDEVVIEYYTDAPYSIETALENGKEIFVVGPEEVHYEDVLIYTNLDENLNIDSKEKIKVYWKEQSTYVNIENVLDLNENGIYDYVEFVAPHLSNQTFVIVLVTKAEHLDENRDFLSDISDSVKYKDDNWSEEILENHYIRATFERPLTSNDDITIYAKILQGNPKIEVYEKNSSELITSFESIFSNQYNKVLLTGFGGSQETFDLKVLNGSLEFDQILDPTCGSGMCNMTGSDLGDDIYATDNNAIFDMNNVILLGWDFSNVPGTATGCSEATLCMYMSAKGNPGADGDAYVSASDRSWSESTIDTTLFDTIYSGLVNTTTETFDSTTVNSYICINVKDQVDYCIKESIDPCTISLEEVDDAWDGTAYSVTNGNSLIFSNYAGRNDYRFTFISAEAISTNLPTLDFSYTEVSSNPQWSNNQTNGTGAGSSIAHKVVWQDDTALSGYIFSFLNGSGSLVNDSFVSMTGTINWTNVTKGINTTIGATIQWKVFVNNSDNNFNETDTWSYVTNNTVPEHTAPMFSPDSLVSSQNFSCLNQSTYDVNGDFIYNAFNWKVDDDPLMLVYLPFDHNITSDLNVTRDYSGRNAFGAMNGSLYGSYFAWEDRAGKPGGYMNFTADPLNYDDMPHVNISAGNFTSISENFTISFWVAPNTFNFYHGYYTFGSNISGVSLGMNAFSGGLFNTINGTIFGVGSWNLANGRWDFYTLACKTNNCSYYMNGTFLTSTTMTPTFDNPDLIIGMGYVNLSGSLVPLFNSESAFDDFRVWNRTLSNEQIYQLYLDTKDGFNFASNITSTETNQGETWTCEVTPVDTKDDGIMLSNSSVILASAAPTTVLVSPGDGTSTYSSASVAFNCNATDDNDIVNISLYGNFTGTWHLNQTITYSGGSDTSIAATFNVSLPQDGGYGWNCEAYDSDNQADFANSNYTLDFDLCSLENIGSNLTLTQDNCVYYNFTADFLELNCDSYKIYGDNNISFWAVSAYNREGVFVKNCRMEQYAQGILFNQTTKSTITNTTLYNNTYLTTSFPYPYGIYLNDSKTTTIEYVNITGLYGNTTSTTSCAGYSQGVFGIYLRGANNTLINYTSTYDVWGAYYGDISENPGCQGGYINLGDSIYVYTGKISTGIDVINSNFSLTYFTHVVLNNYTDAHINNSLFEEAYYTAIQLGDPLYSSGAGEAIIYNNSFDKFYAAGSQAIAISPGTGKVYLLNNLVNNSYQVLYLSDNVVNGVDVMYNKFYNSSASYIDVYTDNANVSHNYFKAGTAYSSSAKAIIFYGQAGSPIFYNNTVEDFYVGTSYGVLTAVIGNFSYMNISNSDYGFYITGIDNVQIFNSTLTNCTYAFYVDSGVENFQVYNVSFNKSSVNFASDGSGFMEVYYDYQVNVTDQDLSPIDAASVDLRDDGGLLIWDGVATAATGLTDHAWVMEYNQTGDAAYVEDCIGSGAYIDCTTPHNTTAYKAGYAVNSTNFTIDYNLLAHLILTTPYIESYVPITDVFSINEPDNQTFSIVYSNVSNVNIKWFVNDSEQTSSANSSTFIWAGNYTQGGKTYEIKVNITDVGDAWDEQIWNMTVNDTNNVPTHDNPLIIPFNGTNAQNFTCYNQSTVDAEGDNVINIYNWKINDTTLMLLNLPFEINVSDTTLDLVADYSGNMNNATVNGTDAVWTDEGKVGGAYNLSGVSSSGAYLTVEDSSSLRPTGNLTIMAWIKPLYRLNTAGMTEQEAIVVKQNGTGASVYNISYGLSIGYNLGREAKMYFVTKDGFLYGSKNDWAAGTWFHVAASYNGSAVAFYVDGQTDNVVGSTGGLNDQFTNDPVFIGTFNFSSGLFNGTIDEVRIYNRSLSAQQIYQIYEDTKNGFSHNNTIVESETLAFENWTCEVTPVDGLLEGETKQNSTILSSAFSVAIALSDKLAQFINWTLSELPVYNQSAEGNNGTGFTEYYVNISVEGGTADLYMKGSGDLMTSGGDVLGLGNETYANHTTNISVPNSTLIPLTTDYNNHLIGQNLEDGSYVYLKFFLNAPAAQAAGNYNNSFLFKAVQSGESP